MAKTGNKVETHSWGRNESITIKSYIIIIYPIKNEWNLHNVFWRDSHNEQSKVEKVCLILTCVSLCVFKNVSMWLFDMEKGIWFRVLEFGVCFYLLFHSICTHNWISHINSYKSYFIYKKQTRKVSLLPLYFSLPPPTFLYLHHSHLIQASTIFVSATVIARYLFQSILHTATGINIAT